ncbi:nucleic acid-binding, OB-fold protein, partial [Tanacetum coccineum]
MKDNIPAKVLEATGILIYHVNTPELQGYILYELEAILNGFGKSVKDFGLPPPLERLLKDLRNKLLMEERNYKRDMLMQDAAHFVELAKQFKKDEIEKLPRPIIIAVSSCRVLKYRDVQLETTPATFYYKNPQTQEAADAYTMFKEKYEFNPPLQVCKYHYVDPEQEKTRNRQTLYTLLQQDPTSFKGVRFTCEAVITNLNKNRRWNYASCSQCNKALTDLDEAYTCKDHGKQDPPTYRYNFKATIIDGTATVEFTFFTEAGQK